VSEHLLFWCPIAARRIASLCRNATTNGIPTSRHPMPTRDKYNVLQRILRTANTYFLNNGRFSPSVPNRWVEILTLPILSVLVFPSISDFQQHSQSSTIRVSFYIAFKHT
jgi:hypothetical protein